MLHAVTTPVFKSVVLGGLLLGAGVGASGLASDATTHRLVLHAPVQANAIYLSAWDRGDVRLKLDPDHLPSLTFRTRAAVSDGCRWLGVERLTPLDDRTYSYDYSEYILECDAGARPCLKTPRTGVVVVHDD